MVVIWSFCKLIFTNLHAYRIITTIIYLLKMYIKQYYIHEALLSGILSLFVIGKFTNAFYYVD